MLLHRTIYPLARLGAGRKTDPTVVIMDGQSVKAAELGLRAFDCGFGSADRMRIVFSERLGVSPAHYRASFRKV